MPSTSKEHKILLALQALEKYLKLSFNKATEIYDVNRMTLTRRCDGRHARCDIPANSRKLTDLEEHTIIQYITELCMRAFPPRLRFVEDMAN